MYETTIDTALIGKKIVKIFVNQDHLRFITEDGEAFTYEVYGDCCSRSVFYDFIGVKKLLENGAVISVKEIELDANGEDKNPQYQDDSISCYGIEIVTENKDFGEQTSVFSFRNYSNGYYGGSLCDSSFTGDLPELTDDTTHIE